MANDYQMSIHSRNERSRRTGVTGLVDDMIRPRGARDSDSDGPGILREAEHVNWRRRSG